MLIRITPVRCWPIWDWLYPPICSVCGGALESGAILICAQCWADAPFAQSKDLRPLRNLDMVRAGYKFSSGGAAQTAIHAFKYHGAKPLSKVMAAKLLTRVPTRFVEAELVWCAVPLHWRRFLFRGFNQSLALSRDLAILTAHASPVRILKRTRATPTQTARTFRERSQNVRGAFAVCAQSRLPESVLLIDDVITTGATVDECARTLKAAGVKWVGALAFALAQQP